jgi:hypothetical protein
MRVSERSGAERRDDENKTTYSKIDHCYLNIEGCKGWSRFLLNVQCCCWCSSFGERGIETMTRSTE